MVETDWITKTRPRKVNSMSTYRLQYTHKSTYLLTGDGSNSTGSGHLTSTEGLGGDFRCLGKQGFLSSVVSDLQGETLVERKDEASHATHLCRLDLQH